MESLHYLLMKAHSMHHRAIASSAAVHGLTSGQPKVLDYLLKNEGVDQKTIASYCEIEQATVRTLWGYGRRAVRLYGPVDEKIYLTGEGICKR